MTVESLSESLAKNVPSPLCGNAVGAVSALALSLGGVASALPLVMHEKKPDAGETPRKKARELHDRFFSLADSDEKAQKSIVDALHAPGITAEQKRRRHLQYNDVVFDGCNVSLELMRACGEAIALLEEYSHAESDLIRAACAEGLALCAGAVRALAVEVYARAARMDKGARRESLCRSAQILTDMYAVTADGSYTKLAAVLAGIEDKTERGII